MANALNNGEDIINENNNSRKIQQPFLQNCGINRKQNTLS